MRLQAIENGDGSAYLCCSALFRLFRACAYRILQAAGGPSLAAPYDDRALLMQNTRYKITDERVNKV